MKTSHDPESQLKSVRLALCTIALLFFSCGDDVGVSLAEQKGNPSVDDQNALRDYEALSRQVLSSLSQEDRSKVCGHEADSTHAFAETLRLFACAEVDIVINADGVWVYRSDELDHRLALSTLLRALPAEKRVWLDVKNLSSRNLDQFMGYLGGERVDRTHFLIETSFLPRTAAEASGFRRYSAEGWTFSFYLPTTPGLKCAARLSVTCRAVAEKIRAQASAASYAFVSYDAGLAPFVAATSLGTAFRQATWNVERGALASLPSDPLLTKVDWYIVPFAKYEQQPGLLRAS